MQICSKYENEKNKTDLLRFFYFFSDLSKEALGAIKFMNCVAVIHTKSKTKFFMEYHSSCLESKDPLYF